MRNPLEHSDQGHPAPEDEKACEKMRPGREMRLKKAATRITFKSVPWRRTISAAENEGVMQYRCSYLKQHFVQASDQKTPALKRKKPCCIGAPPRVCGAHPVSMLFSGAGVPLIGMFQGVASFIVAALPIRSEHTEWKSECR